MRPYPRSSPSPLLIILFTVALLLVPYLASAGGKPIVVFPVNSVPYGKTYSEWSDAWWQWAYSIPQPDNPLFDETGAMASNGQSGPVWFLAGVFNVSGTAERTITVPPGKALFIPILNAEWDNLCPVLDPQPDPEDLVDVLTANVSGFLDAVDALEFEVDGTPLSGLFEFRVGPGAPFSVTFPDNNLFQFFGCSNVTPGTHFPFVSGGYYVMLGPLRKGEHTLRFSGHTTAFGGFGLDITYHITVGDPPVSGGGSLSASVVPNPFNPQAKLVYTTARAGAVKITLFDIHGRLVRTLLETRHAEAGRHDLTIDGRDNLGQKLPSGVYVYRITANDQSTTGRFTILK